MANELDFQYSTSGLSGAGGVVAVLYVGAQIINASDGSLMTDSDANLPNAAIALSDTGHLFRYLGSVPAGTAAGTVIARAYVRAGASLARADTAFPKGSSEPFEWDGTKVVSVRTGTLDTVTNLTNGGGGGGGGGSVGINEVTYSIVER